MKMRNEEMANMADLLSTLEQEGRLGYAIARNERKIRDCCKEYLDKKTAALDKYGVKEDMGDGRVRIIVPFDKQQDYYADLKDFSDIEHDVEIFQVTDEEFCSGTLTSGQMSRLLWMVKQEGEEK